MNIEHHKTLKQVFTKPVPTEIPWVAIESMLRGVGVKVIERPYSQIALIKDGEIMVLSRPYPKPLAVKATVKDIAAFLKAVSVKP